MSANTQGAGAVTVGLAACAACCAGPILGLLGAIGLGALGVAVFGGAGVVIALLVIVSIVRRRPAGTAAADETPVPVPLGRKQR